MGPHVPPDLGGFVHAAGLDHGLDEMVVFCSRVETIGDARPGQFRENDAPVGLEPGIVAHPERRRGGKGQDVGHEVADLVHGVDTQLPVGYADVDVHAEDQQPAGDVLKIGDQASVPVFFRNFLFLPAREGMGAGGHDPVAALLRDLANHASEPGHLAAHFLDVPAHFGTHLHLGLQEFGLDLVPENPLSLLQKLGDVGRQFTGLGVDDLVLLFDAQGHFFKVHGRSRSRYPGPVDCTLFSFQITRNTEKHTRSSRYSF